MAPKKRTRRTLLLLLAIPTVPVLLIALFVGVVLELLHPEPADPELKDRERRALTVRTSPPPTRDSDRCDLKVRALEGIAPVADVEVRWPVSLLGELARELVVTKRALIVTRDEDVGIAQRVFEVR